MDKPRVAFTGYYGMRNFGDDLFGVICTRAAERYWNASSRLVGPPLAGMAGVSTVPAFYPLDWYGAGGALGKGSRLLSFASATVGSDVLVMGGGSVITARESFRKPMMQAARRHRGLKLSAIGVSIGPFANAEQEAAAASFLDRFSYLSVRDRRSHEWIQRMGLSAHAHAGCDLAVLLPRLVSMPVRAQPETGAPLRVGVAPCRYTEGGAHGAPAMRAWEDAFVETLLAESRVRRLVVDVFSLNEHPRHGDCELAEAIARRLREGGVAVEVLRYTQPDPLAMVAAIGRCDAMVSARLHGAIVSWLCGVPFAIVDYHRKCRDFADDIGLPQRRRITTAQGYPFSDVIATLLRERQPECSSPALYADQAEDIFKCAPWALEHAHA
jgi:polysaccharide pyruvyl transferase WcaK-like protein